MVWYGNHGIISIVAQLIIIQMSMDCLKLSICDVKSGYNPARLKGTSGPTKFAIHELVIPGGTLAPGEAFVM